MTNDKTYDLFEGFKQLTEMWERQLNGLLYMMTDNKEFVRTAQMGLDIHSRYMERLMKNQDFIAGVMNLPTKKDVARVAKLTTQAEGKVDGLEEQIWALQEQVCSFSNENLAMVQDMINVVKQLKEDIQNTVQELVETKRLQAEMMEVRQAIVEMRIMQVNLQELQKEVQEMKEAQLKYTTVESNEAALLHTDIQELKQGISQLAEIKREITSLKTLVKKEKEKDKELVLSQAGTSK